MLNFYCRIFIVGITSFQLFAMDFDSLPEWDDISEMLDSASEAQSALKRKRDEEEEPNLKRPRLNETNDIRKVFREGASTAPVMRAFLIAIEDEKGGYYKDQDEGIIYIEKLDDILDYIEIIYSRKKKPSCSRKNRVKTLLMWMDGIPHGNDKYLKQYTVKIRKCNKRIENVMDAYQNFFKSKSRIMDTGSKSLDPSYELGEGQTFSEACDRHDPAELTQQYYYQNQHAYLNQYGCPNQDGAPGANSMTIYNLTYNIINVYPAPVLPSHMPNFTKPPAQPLKRKHEEEQVLSSKRAKH